MGQFDGHRKRLKDRFLEYGLDQMPDHQVLELLLFYAIARQDTDPLARRLLDRFGSLPAVLDAPISELTSVPGIGENTATLLHLIMPFARRYMICQAEKGTVLSTIDDIGKYLISFFYGSAVEMAYLLCMDSKCKVLCCKLLHTGGVNSAGFSLRKAVEIAVNCNASSVVLAHNHPAGPITPSQADMETTTHIKAMLDALDITLIEHIIVKDDTYLPLMQTTQPGGT